MLGRVFAGVLVLAGLVSGPTMASERVAIVVDRPIASAARSAVSALEAALKQQQFDFATSPALPSTDDDVMVLGVAGESPLVDAALRAAEIKLSDKPESLCVADVMVQGRPVLLLAGRDARGLAYAVSDAARAVELTAKDEKPLTKIIRSNESPQLNVRSLSLHLFNEDLERGWYFDEAYWHSYFSLLSRCRYNRFLLTFSDQTNYLCPLYPYLVDMPEYPRVRVSGLTVEQRQKNLSMLARIAELASHYGVEFHLAVWMQAPVPRYAAKVLVEGLPQGLASAEYCALGMKKILAACPEIRGVQLRMNDEAGVHPDEQTEFYRPLFKAIAQCGRPMQLDLRFKGLRSTTLAVANELKLDVSVSTKFSAEHFGLPYHPTVVDPLWRKDRYSYGNLLEHPRSYRVLWQLWTVGSSRVLLWGSPSYVKQFVEQCHLGDGDGFEVFAPLTNKGYGNASGDWPVIKNEHYRVGRWEFERYWSFYLLFGRLGYSPQTSSEVWQREFRARFDEGAKAIEQAYEAASQVLPLITSTRLPSASEWAWWPEMDTGGRLIDYQHIPPHDTAQIYSIRSFKATNKWRWDPWTEKINGYVDDVVAGRTRGKLTPQQFAKQLHEIADRVEQSLLDAPIALKQQDATQWHRTLVDLRVLARLARYHAQKTLAAMEVAFFELTGDAGRLPTALDHQYKAVEQWRTIVQLTAGVYGDNLVFGLTSDSVRSRHGNHHSGHWRDRLSELEADTAWLESLIEKHAAETTVSRPLPAEQQRTWQLVVTHHPPPTADGALPLELRLSLVGPDAPKVERVVVHFRSVDQTRDWQQAVLHKGGDGYHVTLDSRKIESRFDFQYYFEVFAERTSLLSPGLGAGVPYYVVRTFKARENCD